MTSQESLSEGKSLGLPHPPNPPLPSFRCCPLQPSYLPSLCLDRLSGTCWALSCCRFSWTTAGWTQVSVRKDSLPIPGSRKELSPAPSQSGQRMKHQLPNVCCHLWHSLIHSCSASASQGHTACASSRQGPCWMPGGTCC